MNSSCQFLDHSQSLPFCKGCGHSVILRKLDSALLQLNLNPKDVLLVTDIGCIGLSDALFPQVHTVHTTHGRSTAFAAGIAMADAILKSDKLKTIVLLGDGGSMIGLLHLVHTALINVDLTVIVANNFLFGMTGGQQSSLTPLDFITQTSPQGSFVPPLDLCATLAAAGAQSVIRTTTSDPNLDKLLSDEINKKGFSLIEILEMCTEHAVKKNNMKGNALSEIASNQGFALGVIRDDSKADFASTYKSFIAHKESNRADFKRVEQIGPSTLGISKKFIFAGSAGERVQSVAASLCEVATMSGLFTTQKNDNPVTQGSGFSISEVIISPTEIYYTGVDTPDYIFVTSQAGADELEAQEITKKATENTLIYADESVNFSIPKGIVKKNDYRKIYTPARATAAALLTMLRSDGQNMISPVALENLYKKKWNLIL